jgi:hypothetical protein
MYIYIQYIYIYTVYIYIQYLYIYIQYIEIVCIYVYTESIRIYIYIIIYIYIHFFTFTWHIMTLFTKKYHPRFTSSSDNSMTSCSCLTWGIHGNPWHALNPRTQWTLNGLRKTRHAFFLNWEVSPKSYPSKSAKNFSVPELHPGISTRWKSRS